jgi:hypothetical protein
VSPQQQATPIKAPLNHVPKDLTTVQPGWVIEKQNDFVTSL